MGVLSGDYDQVIGVSKHTGHEWEFGRPKDFIDKKVEESWTERAALGSTIVESVVIREDTLELDSSLSVGEEVAAPADEFAAEASFDHCLDDWVFVGEFECFFEIEEDCCDIASRFGVFRSGDFVD